MTKHIYIFFIYIGCLFWYGGFYLLLIQYLVWLLGLLLLKVHWKRHWGHWEKRKCLLRCILLKGTCHLLIILLLYLILDWGRNGKLKWLLELHAVHLNVPLLGNWRLIVLLLIINWIELIWL